MATTVARLEAVLSADTSPFNRGMGAAEAKMSTSQKIIGGAALGIAAGVGYLGVKAVNAAADFEAGLNKMQAVSGATDEQMKKISKTAIALGNDIKLPGTSAKDAAEAMTELSKSGLTVDETMKSVRPTLLLSAAAQISNARAAEITSNALNTFGLDASKTNIVVDQLAATANASSVEIEDVADAFKMAGAVFSGFQGPTLGAEGAITELNTAVGLLGNAGIKGSDAGTSLKQALLQLTGPAGKTKNMMRDLYLATGEGARASQLLETSVHGLSKKIRDEASIQLEKLYGSTKGLGDIAFTAAGKMRPLHEIVGMVTKATRGMTDEQKAFYVTQIFGADASRAVIALMRAGKQGWDEMEKSVTKANAAEELAAAQMKGLRGAQEALKSTVETLAIVFGSSLLPVVTAVTQQMTGLLGLMNEHQTATMIVVGALSAFAVAIIAVLAAMKLYRGILILTTAAKWLFVGSTNAETGAQTRSAAAIVASSVATALHRIRLIAATAATIAFMAAQWLLNAALTANPIGLVIVAVAALAAAVVIAWRRSETFRDIVKGLWEVLKITPLGLVIAHLDDVARKMGAAGEKAVAFGKMAVGPIGAVADSFRSVWRWVDKLIDGAKWLIDNLGKIPLVGGGGGDPFDPRKLLPPQGPVGAGRMDISPKLWDELSAAQSFGLMLTSGYRPGAITASGKRSDHSYYPSKAIDVSGSSGSMARFFTWLIGQRDVKQAFYDPLGSIFNGVLSNYREGGHSDHVHVATYDQGGFLRPGWNLAYNGLGRPEPVGAGSLTINVNGPIYGSKQHLMSMIQNAAQEFKRRNGRGLV